MKKIYIYSIITLISLIILLIKIPIAYSEDQIHPHIQRNDFFEKAFKPSGKKGEKWAVIIGIGDYKDPDINDLSCTVSDAKAIYELLLDRGGFKADKVKLLLDKDATTKNIKSALKNFLSSRTKKNDTVFIYYSGHGAAEASNSSDDGDGIAKYIVTYDSDIEKLYETAFPMEEIKGIFQEIKAGKIIFFIDACYSGAGGGRTCSLPDLNRENLSAKFLDDIAREEGRIVITASGPGEVSLELPELGHGVFTYFLLEGLYGKADINKDSIITVDETFDYLYNKVVETSRYYGENQHPVKKGDGSGKFVLIKF